jgi:8-oxo-dGTP pyrophosphatase MutT (NUDIX family)
MVAAESACQSRWHDEGVVMVRAKIKRMDEAPILRPAARVLLIDARDRLLLIRARLEAEEVWLTPGGGVKEGETFEEGALRELWEETGVGDVDLSPCVWMRTHVFPWDGQVYKQQERYFVCLVDEVELTDRYREEAERTVLTDFRWWSLAAVEASTATFVPRDLRLLLPAILAGDYPTEPLALGI